MNRTSTWIGLALVVVGVLWTLQGLGLVGGSPMTGVAFWAGLGPLVALVGVTLAARGLRER